MLQNLDFSRDGYYLIRPSHNKVEEIEFVERSESLPFRDFYKLIDCQTVERVQLAEGGFSQVVDPNMFIGIRFDPVGVMVDAWLDENGMDIQEYNPLATHLAKSMSYIDVSYGLWGNVLIPCGKAILPEDAEEDEED